MSVRAGVLIPAGGAGRRMGGVRKPFMMLAGEPLLAHTLRPFLAIDDVVAIVVALAPADAADEPAWLRALDDRIRVVAGGSERGDSVRQALAALPEEASVVLVHDAARPLLTRDLVERAIHAAARGINVVAAIPVVDTIKEVDAGGRVVATPDRRALWQAQTPQAFPRHVLADAHRRAAQEGIGATDDAALVARYGATGVVIEGEPDNLKVTAPADVAIAEALLLRRAGLIRAERAALARDA
jgi:2-C-methyl-D-erythritol 4-phosphate cytidylyltransferase